MRITNLQVYDMNNSIRASGYPMKERLDLMILTGSELSH